MKRLFRILSVSALATMLTISVAPAATSQETSETTRTETSVTAQESTTVEHRTKSRPVIRIHNTLSCNSDNLRGSFTVGSGRSKVVIVDDYEDEVLDRGTVRRSGTYGFNLPEVDYGDSGAWRISVTTYFRGGGYAYRTLYVERERPSWRSCHRHGHHNGDHDWDDDDDDDDHWDDESHNGGVTVGNS